MFIDNGMESGVQPAFSAPDMAGNIPFLSKLEAVRWALRCNIFSKWETPPRAILADKAYGGAKIRQQFADEGAVWVGSIQEQCAPSHRRHPIAHDKSFYAMRNIVERFFCKMKDMRRLATRFEKYATSFCYISSPSDAGSIESKL